MKDLIIVFLLVGFLVGCMKEPQETSVTTNSEFNIQLLFEHDSCKVYRFYDGGRAIYYTDCKGETNWRDGGKHKIDHQVTTSK